jgi:hypothetical protein
MAAKMVLAALKHIWATLEPTCCSHALIGGLSFLTKQIGKPVPRSILCRSPEMDNLIRAEWRENI